MTDQHHHHHMRPPSATSARTGSHDYDQENSNMAVPYGSNHRHDSSWMGRDGVLSSIATACNLCDMYVHQQVKHEWDMEGKDTMLDGSSFDELDKDVQIQVYKKILFDESSIRIDDEDEPLLLSHGQQTQQQSHHPSLQAVSTSSSSSSN